MQEIDDGIAKRSPNIERLSPLDPEIPEKFPLPLLLGNSMGKTEEVVAKGSPNIDTLSPCMPEDSFISKSRAGKPSERFDGGGVPNGLLGMGKSLLGQLLVGIGALDG